MSHPRPPKRLTPPLAIIVAMSAAGCGGDAGSPDAVDLEVPVDSAVETSPVDPDPGPPPDPLACDTARDCPTIDDCCLEAICHANRCGWNLRPSCCTEPGPCAVTSAMREAECSRPCEAHGCEARMRLADSCDEAPMPIAIAQGRTLHDLRDTRSGLAWQRSLRVPLEGSPSLLVADARCDRLHHGPLGPDCGPLFETSDAYRLEWLSEPMDLPSGRPLIVQGLIHDGRDPNPLADTLSRPRIRLEAVTEQGGVLGLWRDSEEPARPTGRWTPLAAELSQLGGQSIRLRIVVEASAGRARRDTHLAFGGFQVRVPCLSERDDFEPATACELPVTTPIQPLADALLLGIDPHAERPCQTCQSAATCEPAEACGVVRCEDGRCVHASAAPVQSVACCDLPDNQAGSLIPAADLDLDHWTRAGDPWTIEEAPDAPPRQVLRFPLAAFTGNPSGTLTSPPITLPGPVPFLRARMRLETEWDLSPSTSNPLDIDAFRIEFVPAPEPSEPSRTFDPITIWHSRSVGGTTEGHWVGIATAIPSTAGARGHLRLRFDANDPEFNDFGGVWVDRLSVDAACGPCLEATDCGPEVPDISTLSAP